jgi:hypothetical protein
MGSPGPVAHYYITAEKHMTEQEIIHVVGVSIGLGIIQELRRRAAVRKERRSSPGYDHRTEFSYKIAKRLGQLWARCQKRSRRALAE